MEVAYNHACYPGGEQKMQGSLGKQAFCTPFISSKPFLLPDHARPVQVTRISYGVRVPVSVSGSQWIRN